MKDNLLIYIAGYGRSGSTVLDLAMSTISSGSIGCGELGQLPRFFVSERLGCSCGAQYKDCQLWGPILDNVFKENPKLDLKNIYYQDGLRGFFAKPSQQYISFWEKLFDSRADLKNSSKAQNWVMIDSTKTVLFNCSRPLNLTYLQGVRVVVVHLKRSLHGVMASRRKGRNCELAGFYTKEKLIWKLLKKAWWLIVPINWFLSNLFASISKNNPRVDLAINVNFEDVQKSPELVALDIFEQINLKFNLNLQYAPTLQGKAFPNHMVEGNRLVREKNGVLIRQP